MSDGLVAVICEDACHHGLARLLEVLVASRPAPRASRRVVYLSSLGVGGLLPMALRVVRNGVPNLAGERPSAVAVVVDADRAFEVQRRALHAFERRPRTPAELAAWHRPLQSQVQFLLREQTYEADERARLFAFALCWSLESVALALPGRFARLVGATEGGAAALDASLAACEPADPRVVPPDEFAVRFQRPGECFKRLYRAATERRPGKERVSDTVRDLADALGAEGDDVLARVPGLTDLMSWLTAPGGAAIP